ncbi:hypothetical protein, partial [Flagellimonas onchidii]|uniref:hypothetical protein n=1 Tax=Flagellimonas onchidii TaxID=2562684 RepID=UPI001455FF5E
DVDDTIDAMIGGIKNLFNDLFSQKEDLLDQLSETQSVEEQQNIISKINDVEVTIAQQIDNIPGKEHLPQELQQELQDLKQEAGIAGTGQLSPQEIEDIKTADAGRRERINEIATVAENYSPSSSFDFEIAQSLVGIYKEGKLSSSMSPNSAKQNVFDYEGLFSARFEEFLTNLLIGGEYKIKIYTYNSQLEIFEAIESIVPKSDEVIILMQKNTSKVLVKLILGEGVSRDLLDRNITKEELVKTIQESTPSSLKSSILFDEIKRHLAAYSLIIEAEAYDGNVVALIAIKLLDWGIQGIENFELPGKYYNPAANDYSPLLGGDAVNNAFVCGIYNGLIREAKALPELVSLLIKISASKENQTKLQEEINRILETGILQTLIEELVDNYDLDANGVEMVAYQFGIDMVALATMFVSFGELTKAGKVTNITRLADPLRDSFGVFRLSAKARAKVKRSGDEIVLHRGHDFGNLLAKVDANNIYREIPPLPHESFRVV